MKLNKKNATARSFDGLAVFFSIYCVEFFTEIDYNIFMLILGTR